MIVCAAICGLALLTITVVVILGWQQAGRVEAAVRATMPSYCSGPTERMYVFPRNQLLGSGLPVPANEWHVSCLTPVTCQPLITVNVPRCEAQIVTAFNGTYTETLSVCP